MATRTNILPKKNARSGQKVRALVIDHTDTSLTDRSSQCPSTSITKNETGPKPPFSKFPLTINQGIIKRFDRRSKILPTPVPSTITTKSPRLVSPVASNAHLPTLFEPLCLTAGHCPPPSMCQAEATRRGATKLAPLALHQVTNADVLCGRGAGTNTHPGNVRFRTLVAQYQATYLQAKALEKTEIAKTIVQDIRNFGGRFLKKIESPQDQGGRWYDIGDKAAREKTCQALRERGPSPGELPSLGIPTNVSKSDAKEVKRNLEMCDNPTGQRAILYAQKSQIIPTDKDVLLGRGGVTNTHAGNKYYRDLVRRKQPEYLSSPKMRKAWISKSIVEEIHANGGRFLRDIGNGTWQIVNKDKAKEKTSQALREKAPEMRRVYLAAASLLDTNKLKYNPPVSTTKGVTTAPDTKRAAKAIPPDEKEGQGPAGKEIGGTRRGPLYKKQKVQL